MKTRTGPSALLSLFISAGLTACGGGGGDGGDGPGTPPPPPPGSSDPPWTQGVFESSNSFAAQCVTPRTGINPLTGVPYTDVRGSNLTEMMWLRSWSNELYLWYNEVVDRQPFRTQTPQGYFEGLVTDRLDEYDQLKDRFHFQLSTEEWIDLAQSGASLGFGVQWAVRSGVPPRDVVAAYVEPNSPAGNAGLVRGTRLLGIDGVDINDNTNAGIDVLNEGLGADRLGESHSYLIRDPNTAVMRNVTLQATTVETDPVQTVKTFDTSTGRVGYMVFMDHVATAEKELIDAFTTLRDAGVTDLILDLRYNGGGFLDIASEVAYMIAGPERTTGKTFELLQFNNKHPTINPVTQEPLAPVGFHSQAQGFSAPEGQPLPSLNLGRLFVITGENTCSASESIMNSLQGIDVEVIQIGGRTCGKPFGFYATDNCGTTYFTIQFRGLNAKGFGHYSAGFVPQGSSLGTALPGCAASDDFDRALGDASERRLAAALEYVENDMCFLFATALSQSQGAALAESDVKMLKSPWLMNRIMRK